MSKHPIISIFVLLWLMVFFSNTKLSFYPLLLTQIATALTLSCSELPMEHISVIYYISSNKGSYKKAWIHKI